MKDKYMKWYKDHMLKEVIHNAWDNTLADESEYDEFNSNDSEVGWCNTFNCPITLIRISDGDWNDIYKCTGLVGRGITDICVSCHRWLLNDSEEDDEYRI